MPLYLFLEKQISSSVDFLYGYPNDNSSPFFLKMFKYKLYPSKFFQVKITSQKNANFIIENSLKKFAKYSIEKPKEYIRWRFFNNPICDYYYINSDDKNYIWKKHLNGIDILAVLPNSIPLELEKKPIIFKNRVLNFFISNHKIKLEDDINELTLKSVRNSFVVKKINPNLFYDELVFQMLDIDIF